MTFINLVDENTTIARIPPRWGLRHSSGRQTQGSEDSALGFRIPPPWGLSHQNFPSERNSRSTGLRFAPTTTQLLRLGRFSKGNQHVSAPTTSQLLRRLQRQVDSSDLGLNLHTRNATSTTTSHCGRKLGSSTSREKPDFCAAQAHPTLKN